MTASLPSPTGMWGSVPDTSGYRFHAFARWDVYDYETACGIALVDVTHATGEEPDWNADVPNPPKPCPACRKALAAGA